MKNHKNSIAVKNTDIAVKTTPGQQLMTCFSRIGGIEVLSVPARDLHKFLEVQTRFDTWFDRRIQEYGFKKDNDFVVLPNGEQNPSGGRPVSDCFISFDMAKELCMVERNAKGKQARQYFIEIEKQYKQIAKVPKTTAEILVAQAQAFLEQERALSEIKQVQKSHAEEIKKIKAKVITSQSDYFTVSGFANLRGISLDIRHANMIGRRCAKLSKEYGYHIGKVKDERFGEVNIYHSDILTEVFKETS